MPGGPGNQRRARASGGRCAVLACCPAPWRAAQK
jgi:hypothetical protein